MTIKFFSTPLILTGLLIAAPACSDDGGSDDENDETAGEEVTADETEGPAEFDEAAALAKIADYQTGSFELINAAPFMSQTHAMGTVMVNIYVDSSNAAQYKAIDPASPMSDAFPEGTIVVKEHFDPADLANTIGGTVMVKGPAGYSADSGDWWFGNGNLLTGELMASGPDLSGCIGCHSAQGDSDWMFGVPAADQTP